MSPETETKLVHAATKSIERMLNIPSLSWLNGKTHSNSGDSRRNRPGRSWEHQEAFIENGSRTLATEVEKILHPKSEAPVEAPMVSPETQI